ncbi:MAG: hypothetical protein H8Z69_00495 [Nanohaloarchaea archaeon]|nr:hypothetical protein [Candidatus Nanohaloarchaea archaeon]
MREINDKIFHFISGESVQNGDIERNLNDEGQDVLDRLYRGGHMMAVRDGSNLNSIWNYSLVSGDLELKTVWYRPETRGGYGKWDELYILMEHENVSLIKSETPTAEFADKLVSRGGDDKFFRRIGKKKVKIRKEDLEEDVDIA